jgi:hypothetical protein
MPERRIGQPDFGHRRSRTRPAAGFNRPQRQLRARPRAAPFRWSDTEAGGESRARQARCELRDLRRASSSHRAVFSAGSEGLALCRTISPARLRISRMVCVLSVGVDPTNQPSGAVDPLRQFDRRLRQFVEAFSPMVALRKICLFGFVRVDAGVARVKEPTRRAGAPQPAFESFAELAHSSDWIGWTGRAKRAARVFGAARGRLWLVRAGCRRSLGRAHKDKRPLHVHRHDDELEMAGVAGEPQVADAAHGVPALHRRRGALDG